MKTHFLKGSKEEIAESLIGIAGVVREAIVFEDELPPVSPQSATDKYEDIFAEMNPYMVDAQDLDDSREAIYTRMDGE